MLTKRQPQFGPKPVNNLVYFVLLQFQGPENILWPIAVLVFEPSTDRLHVQGRDNFEDIADPDDVVVLAETIKQLHAETGTQSGTAILTLLEDTLSNAIRLSERITLRSPDIATTIKHLSAALFF